MEIRTRFAPSPTGFMHVGNLRTCLYGYLFAKKNNGKFILRIEDTDQERYVEGAVEIIYNTLKKAGIEHDEGPDKDGGVGPYIQSERKSLYLEYAKKLVELGGAYYCFCDKERLDSLIVVCHMLSDKTFQLKVFLLMWIWFLAKSVCLIVIWKMECLSKVMVCQLTTLQMLWMTI